MQFMKNPSELIGKQITRITEYWGGRLAIFTDDSVIVLKGTERYDCDELIVVSEGDLDNYELYSLGIITEAEKDKRQKRDEQIRANAKAALSAAVFDAQTILEEEQANAQLISAAPDMIEALKAVVEFPKAGYTSALVRKAIAKAEGK